MAQEAWGRPPHLDLLAAAKIPVKVNPVMIPGINDAHLAEVSRVVKEKGAFLHNIMPLISDHAHGTAFGLAGQRGPAGAELAALQDRLGGGARLMRHCRQCRADAAGMLGEDRGQDFTADGGPEEDGCDPAPREAYRAVAIGTIDAHRLARSAANARLATMPDAPAVTVAIATRGGGRINRHFGHAREFQVYAVSPAGVTLEGIRKVDHYCQGGWGDGASLDATVAALDGVAAVLCARVGTCPRESMPAAGIPVSDGHAYGWIEEGIAAWYMAAFPSAVRRLA